MHSTMHLASFDVYCGCTLLHPQCNYSTKYHYDFVASNGIMKRWYYDLLHELDLHVCLHLPAALLYPHVSACQLLLYPCVSTYQLLFSVFSPLWSLLSTWYLHCFILMVLPLCDCLRVYHHDLYLQFISTWVLMGFTSVCWVPFLEWPWGYPSNVDCGFLNMTVKEYGCSQYD